MVTQSIYKSKEGEERVLTFYESILGQWPVPHERMEIPARLGRTFLIASGKKSAPPLFLLHGSGSNSATWMGEVAEYAREYRVFAVDIPGDPGKSEPVRPDYNSPAYADWLDDIYSHLGIGKAVLVGLSLGGWIALNFALSRPEKVDKLVLLCASGLHPARVSFLFKAIFLSLLGPGGQEKLKRMIFYNAPITREAEDFFNLLLADYTQRMDVLPLFSDDELKRLEMPVLYLGGRHDVLIDAVKSGERLARMVPRGQTKILDDMGHALINMYRHVLPFLKA